MPPTFSGACSVAAPCLVDVDASQDTGACTTGIGLANDDGDPLTGMTDQYIGGAVAAHVFETDADLATPP